MEQFICKYCRKICKNANSLRNHERLCKLNPNYQINPMKNKIPWNKGRKGGENQYTKAKKEGRPIPKYDRKPTFLGRHHTEETKRKISESISINNHGGRCKWYNYNGIWVQGTWELSIAKKLDTFQINWKKTKELEYTLKYIDDNTKEHTYNPDFYLQEYDCFLEIKGHWWGNDKRKMELVMQQNPSVKIIIIEKDLFALLLSADTKEEFLQLLNL